MSGNSFDETERISAQWERVRAARLLIVDDEPSNVTLLQYMLEGAQYANVEGTTDSREVVALVSEHRPDIVLLDLMMPHLDGISVIEQLRAASGGILDPEVIVLTADTSPESKRHALRLGARDFLTKPFDVVELLLRIENVLEVRFLRHELQNQNVTLERRVQERTAKLQIAQKQLEQYASDLEAANTEILERLALAGELRDNDTGRHTLRVGRVSMLIAEGLRLSPNKVRWIGQAARLHDVGKIGVSDGILMKHGSLEPVELATMRTHTAIGGKLFAGANSGLMRMAARIAKAHHEKWDGTGYPLRLAGTRIAIEARIVAVADVFDALTHSRPYKKAWPVHEAVAEIKAQSGRHFDPRIVEIFLRLPHAELI